MEENSKNASETHSQTNKTSSGSGLDPKIAAALCWGFAPLSSIIFLLIEKDSNFVKFHAYESLFAMIALYIMGATAAALTIVIIGALLAPLVGIAGFVVWIMGMVKAYKGEMWKLPIIGDMAEKYANT